LPVNYTPPGVSALAVWQFAAGPRTLSGTRTLSLGIGVCVTNAAAGVKGGYTQIIAATAAAVSGIMIRIFASLGDVLSTLLVDIAIGAGGAEVVVAENVKCQYIKTAGVQPNEISNQIYISNLNIPAGTRVAARASQSNAGAVNVSVEVCGSQ